MGLLQQLEDRLLSGVLAKIKAALGPFGKLFDLVGKFFTGFKDSISKGTGLAKSVIAEINAWRNFREAVPVRTGVISLPRAIEKTQELLDQIRSAWTSIADLASKIKTSAAGGEDPAVEAEQAVKDIEASGIKEFLTKFPKLARGVEKVLGFLALAVQVLEYIKSAIDDIQAILDAITAIREEIETGATIFLSQKNPRKTVETLDGEKLKLRVGNLH